MGEDRRERVWSPGFRDEGDVREFVSGREEGVLRWDR